MSVLRRMLATGEGLAGFAMLSVLVAVALAAPMLVSGDSLVICGDLLLRLF